MPKWDNHTRFQSKSSHFEKCLKSGDLSDIFSESRTSLQEVAPHLSPTYHPILNESRRMKTARSHGHYTPTYFSASTPWISASKVKQDRALPAPWLDETRWCHQASGPTDLRIGKLGKGSLWPVLAGWHWPSLLPGSKRWDWRVQ